MGNKIILILLSILWTSQLQAAQYFVGIQPEIATEHYYADDEFDINIFPLVLGLKVNRHSDYKTNVIVNYHLGAVTEVAQVGLGHLLAWHFIHLFGDQALEKGPFIGPFLGYSYDLPRQTSIITAAAELGYTFYWQEGSELKLGLQFGESFFLDREESANHFGIKVSFGYWL